MSYVGDDLVRHEWIEYGFGDDVRADLLEYGDLGLQEHHSGYGAYTRLYRADRYVRDGGAAGDGGLFARFERQLGPVIGIGFTGALTLLGAVRELLGTGKFFGLTLMPEEYGSLIFILAPGAFIVLGYLIAIVNKLHKA